MSEKLNVNTSKHDLRVLDSQTNTASYPAAGRVDSRGSALAYNAYLANAINRPTFLSNLPKIERHFKRLCNC